MHSKMAELNNVSDRWKHTFSLLEKAGGPKKPDYNAVSFGERARIVMNPWAYLLGPLYYLFLGMWRKAIALTAACLLVVVPLMFSLDAFGLERLSDSLRYGVAAIFAMRANIDYYKKMVLNDNGWW